MHEPQSLAAARQARMIARLKQLAPEEGYTRSLLDDVTFMRANRALESTPALYEPSIVIVVQGRKSGLHGGKRYVYDARHYLALSVPLPFSIETEASETEPLLGLALRIDPTMTAELAVDLAPDHHARPVTLYATALDERLEDAAARLLDALSVPEEARLLGPAICREITYRVLTGEQGGNLRAALQQGGHFGRIARVLRHIHGDYARSIDVPGLAAAAGMSVAVFHQHFKAVTTTSPLQYVKAVRLHQARLMMIRNGTSAAQASAQVGYESPSQFSREFRRMFGRTPTDEVRHLKALLQLSEPVQRV